MSFKRKTINTTRSSPIESCKLDIMKNIDESTTTLRSDKNDNSALKYRRTGLDLGYDTSCPSDSDAETPKSKTSLTLLETSVQRTLEILKARNGKLEKKSPAQISKLIQESCSSDSDAETANSLSEIFLSSLETAIECTLEILKAQNRESEKNSPVQLLKLIQEYCSLESDGETPNSKGSLSSLETSIQCSLEILKARNRKSVKESLLQISKSSWNEPLESKETGTTADERGAKEKNRVTRSSSRFSTRKSERDTQKKLKRLKEIKEYQLRSKNRYSENWKTKVKSVRRRGRPKKSDMSQINVVTQQNPIPVPKGGEKLTHSELASLFLQFREQGFAPIDKGMDSSFQIGCYNPEHVYFHNDWNGSPSTAVQQSSDNTNRVFQNKSNEINLPSFSDMTQNSDPRYKYQLTASSSFNNGFYNDTSNKNNNNCAATASTFDISNNISNNESIVPGDFNYYSISSDSLSCSNNSGSQVECSQMWNYDQQWQCSTVTPGNATAGFVDGNVYNDRVANDYYASYDANYDSNNNNNLTDLDVNNNNNVVLPPFNSWYNRNDNSNNSSNDVMLQSDSLWDLNNNEIDRDYNYFVNLGSNERYETPVQTNSSLGEFLENTDIRLETEDAIGYRTYINM